MNKINEIQQYLKNNDLGGVLVSHGDIFFNEYVQQNNNFIRYATNFNGSAGFLAIYQNKATLFVDGRYTIEAKNIIVDNLKIKNFSFDEIENDILQNMENEKFVFDCEYFSYQNFLKFSQIENINLCGIEKLFFSFDKCFGDYFNKKKYFAVCENLSSKNFNTKLNLIKQNTNSNYLIITDTSNLSWLLGVRGFDILNNPTINGYGILNLNNNILNVYTSLNNCENILNNNENINYFDIEIFYEKLKLLTGVVEICFEKINYKIFNCLQNCESKKNHDVIDYIKCVKDDKEYQNIKNAHIQDGVAMVKFLSYIDNKNYDELDELSLQKKLNLFRKNSKNFIMNSFETISGVNSNGAICHYKVSNITNKKFSKNNVYLVDSGSHYTNGTTDITRTIFKGEFNKNYDKISTAYTLVLKAMIAVSKIRSKVELTGKEIDNIGRRVLQKNGLDFNHSIGHGVGCCLNVHEGPFSISPRDTKKIPPNILLSNEPGYYTQNNVDDIDGFGIRIENLIFYKFDGNEYFFETITLCPIDKKLINKNLMDDGDIKWLNDYHGHILNILINQNLTEHEKKWLVNACEKI